MRERAQLVLVAALVLGAVFVGFAIIVNAVIFTENLATRQDTAAQNGAVEFRDASREAVAELVARVNRDHDTSHDALRSNLSAAVATWSRTAVRDLVARGVTAQVDVVGVTDGTHVQQTNASRDFTAGGSSSGSGNWTLVDAERTRRFRLNVSADDLTQRSVSDPPSDSELANATAEAFRINVTDATGSTAHVYLFDDGGTVRVVVEDATGTYHGEDDAGCQTDEAWATVDLVAGTVEGASCSALDVYDPTSPHTVRFENATVGGSDRAAGTYELITEPSSVPSSNYYDADAGDSPFTTPAIYAATVRVQYHADDLRYRGRVEIVP